MRVGMTLGYAGGFAETVAELADFEQAGLDIVFVPEAYSFDAVTSSASSPRAPRGWRSPRASCRSTHAPRR